MHRHKAITKLDQVIGWTHCITPDACAAKPLRQAAHGNIIVVGHCSCGATRLSEHNGKINFGPWTDDSGQTQEN